MFLEDHLLLCKITVSCANSGNNATPISQDRTAAMLVLWVAGN
jgi:hypothetical protein